MLKGPRTRWACVQISASQAVDTDAGRVPHR